MREISYPKEATNAYDAQCIIADKHAPTRPPNWHNVAVNGNYL